MRTVSTLERRVISSRFPGIMNISPSLLCFPVIPVPSPYIYILDIEWFLKTFFDEIRHIESCLKYQAANWEKVQAKVAMNESYRVLIQLIDEILNAYDLKLQASPPHRARASSQSYIRVRDAKGAEREVSIKVVSQKGRRLFLDRDEVTFTGYRKRDIHIILSVPIFEVMSPHVLKRIRQELTQYQYKKSVECWCACEIRIQELGKRYETGLLG